MGQIIGQVAQIRHAEHRLADQILEVDRRAVHGVVGVALGGEALVLAVNVHHPVGGHHQVLVHDKGDGVPHLNLLRRDLFDINQRAGGVSGLHTAAEDHEGGQPHQPHAHQQHRQQNDRRHQHRRHDIPQPFQQRGHRLPSRLVTNFIFAVLFGAIMHFFLCRIKFL